jgi:nucleoside-diphosphate-sugar epimerase
VRVFVAGATGAIGRRLVPRLVAAGHEVTGLTRSEQRAAGLREAGANAVIGDALDEAAVRKAMAEASPEVVVHQLTSLPQQPDFRDEKQFEATNRLRREGTRILIEGARAAGARRVVAQSIAFMYEPSGDRVKREEDPLAEETPGGVSDHVRALERAVTQADGIEGLVLRYGAFYGPGTWYAPDGAIAEMVRKRRFPVVGSGDGVTSFVQLDDAANATLVAVERGAPGTYNITDDEPARMGDWVPAYAEAIGAPKPRRVPKWVVRLAAGKGAAEFAAASRGASNEKAKRELGWQPDHPSWRQGFREAFG